jgi:hypothetical protein
MMAADVFDQVDDKAPPAALAQTVRSHAAAAFVVVAGISLARSFGGDQQLHGRGRIVIRAVIAVQAVLVVVIGLVLGFSKHTTVILAYYGLLCLLTIPILGCRPKLLARIAALMMVVAPIIVTATVDSGAPGPEGNLTFTSLIADPSGLITALFVTGFYPVLSYLAFIIAGLAIGRLDMSSAQAVPRLLVGGLALALIGWASWLALPASRSHAWISFVHNLQSLGSGVALVGVVLLLVRIPAMTCLLWPITAARDDGAHPLQRLRPGPRHGRAGRHSRRAVSRGARRRVDVRGVVATVRGGRAAGDAGAGTDTLRSLCPHREESPETVDVAVAIAVG